jgi:hypothetical protein
MKKLSTFLRQRQDLLRQARLANLAFAYRTLGDFAERIARAQLTGRVTLRPVAPDAEHYWPTLTALDANQSVIEEHFTDEDILELADTLAFIVSGDATEFTFHLEDLGELFLAPLRVQLQREGIAIDRSGARSDAVRRLSF